MSEEKELTARDVLDAPDAAAIPPAPVSVPELGGRLHVRVLSGAERDAWEATIVETRGKDRVVNLRNIRARLAALCCCDAAGKRMFTDAQAEALGRKSARALERIFSAARKVNGLSEEDVEELAGNSPSGPSGSSGSGSPA